MTAAVTEAVVAQIPDLVATAVQEADLPEDIKELRDLLESDEDIELEVLPNGEIREAHTGRALRQEADHISRATWRRVFQPVR